MMGSFVCVYQAFPLLAHEHVLAWLRKDAIKSANSFILYHLMVDSKSHVYMDEAFSVLCLISNNLPKGSRYNLST